MGLGNAVQNRIDSTETMRVTRSAQICDHFQVPAPSNPCTWWQNCKFYIVPFAWIFNSMSFHIISGWYTEFPYWVLDKKWWERKSEQKMTGDTNNWSTSFYNINLVNVPSDQEPGITFGSPKSVVSSQRSVYVRVLALRCDDHCVQVFDANEGALGSFRSYLRLKPNNGSIQCAGHVSP